MSAFDTFSKFGSFLSRPKDDDFELIYKEHRFQPFWHVVANARYVYDRNSGYQVAVSGKEVRSVTYDKSDFEVTNSHFHLPVVEHCVQEEEEEVFVDGVTGKNVPELKRLISLSPKEVSGKLDKLVSKDSIFV